MAVFSLVSATRIPKDDGSHANDWVTNQWALPETVDGQDDFPNGPRRAAILEVRLKVYSGTGPNSWAIEPIFVLDEQVPSDAWRTWPHLPIASAGTCPVVVASTELPYGKLYRVPLKMCFYALKFTRSGAGNIVLDVEFNALGAASV